MGYPDQYENAQRVLRTFATYTGAIDGDIGPRSLRAARRVPFDYPAAWPPTRIAVAAMQFLLRAHGPEDPGLIDGLYGPQTDAAFEIWRAYGRDGGFERPHDLPEPHPAGRWPAEADLVEWFGPPDTTACTAGSVRFPWRTVLAWDPREEVSAVSCHVDVEGSLRRVFEEIADTHSPDQIRDLGLDQYGGCFNPRRKRGGTSWSTHAWGIAIDIDPARNRLRWDAPRARLSQPDATGVWEAFEAEGWTSLGRAKDFDWMHVQAARP